VREVGRRGGYVCMEKRGSQRLGGSTTKIMFSYMHTYTHAYIHLELYT